MYVIIPYCVCYKHHTQKTFYHYRRWTEQFSMVQHCRFEVCAVVSGGGEGSGQ